MHRSEACHVLHINKSRLIIVWPRNAPLRLRGPAVRTEHCIDAVCVAPASSIVQRRAPHAVLQWPATNTTAAAAAKCVNGRMHRICVRQLWSAAHTSIFFCALMMQLRLLMPLLLLLHGVDSPLASSDKPVRQPCQTTLATPLQTSNALHPP
jgi:hypothetical protein